MPDISYSRAYPGGWQNLPSTDTAVTADALTHVEDGIVAVTTQANTALSTAAGALQQSANLSDLTNPGAAMVNVSTGLTTTEKNEVLSNLGVAQGTVTVANLTYPMVIAHRGGANLWPENSLAAYEGAVSLGVPAVEAGDLHMLADGSLLCMHDTTLDRTTTNTGPVATLSGTGARRLVMDASQWFGGGWPDQPVPLFDDVLDRIGGATVMVPQVGDDTDAQAQAICDRINARGLADSCIVQSFTLSNCTVAANAGIAAMYLLNAVDPTYTPAQLVAAGVQFVAPYYTLSDLATQVANWHAAGLKVIVWTCDRQWEWDIAVAAGCDGLFTNEPFYAPRNYAAYRKSATSWSQNSTWTHGMVSAVAGGPYTITDRGVLLGPVGFQRWSPPQYVSGQQGVLVVPGEICPLPNPTGTYTLTFTLAIEAVGNATSNGTKIYFGCPNDQFTGATSDVPSSHLAIMRQGGQISCYTIDGTGVATSQGNVTTGAPQTLTTSAALTGGTAYTAIPVAALAQAVQVGHQWILPTGQVTTASATAVAGATSVTVTSFTPTATVASGSVLPQQITLTIAVTPTGVTVTRTDGTDGSVAYTFAGNRGGYVQIFNENTAVAGGNASIVSIGVS